MVPFFSELRRRNVFRAAAAYVALSWVLMQVAEVTFPAFGFTDRALRMLIIALGVGFVPAVALAWVFELTPEGVKRDRDIDPEGPLAQRTNRLVDRLIIVVLALGIAYFAADKFLLDPARDEARVSEAIEQGRGEAIVESYGDKSIVVLPFENLSSDPEQEFFSDGMAEELLNLLAQIPELRVISRSSAFSFKDKNATVAEIAEQLNVAHVLEGSVRKSGDRLRITAQLIDARTDSHLWSETYDRSLDNIFAIQDDIAGQVVEQLRIKLLGTTPAAKRVNPQAYLLRMQARQMIDQLDDDYQRIEDLLKQAIALDPDYADALVDLSRLYSLYTRGSSATGEINEFFATSTAEDWNRLSTSALTRALELEPDNARAVALSAGRKLKQLEFQGAATGMERALTLDPTDPEVLRYSSRTAAVIGRFDVAVPLGEYATERDPLCSLCIFALGHIYIRAGLLDKAESSVRTYVATGRGGRHTLGTLLLLKGEPQKALESFRMIDVEDQPHLAPWRLQGEALALHALGSQQDSADALLALESDWGQKLPHLPAEVYAWTGRADLAFEWLAKIEKPRWIDPFSPLLEPLREDARWVPYWQQFGQSPVELTAIRFDPVLPDS